MNRNSKAFDAVMDRLKLALGITQDKELALRLGMKPTTFAERKRGGKSGEPSIPTDKVLDVCRSENLNPKWALEGEGPMRVSEGEVEFERRLAVIRGATNLATRVPGLSEDERRLVQEIIIGVDACSEVQVKAALNRASGVPGIADFVMVPKYDIHASAGNGSVIHDEAIVDHLAFKRDWIRQSLGLDPSCLALIDVRGDSMSPTIDGGDLLLLDTRPGQARSEGVYVLNLNGTLLVKRIRIRLSGVVEIVSDNPQYGSESISGEELERLVIVGRVVWHGRKF